MNTDRLMTLIQAPVISEKSTLAADNASQYVFRVVNDATKSEIKQAVELMFDVKVEKVNVANMKPKPKRFGTSYGQRKGWRKAYVKLAAGQDLDFV